MVQGNSVCTTHLYRMPEWFAQDQTAGKFCKESLNPKCYNPKHHVHFFHYTLLIRHPPKGRGTQFCIILS